MQTTRAMKFEHILMTALFAACAALALGTTALMFTTQAPPAVQLARPLTPATPALNTPTAASVRAPTKA